MNLRIHSFLPCSRANGPGARAVIWTQGCSLGCPGCFNPDTHDLGQGKLVSVDELFDRIDALGQTVEGLTVSGGEPLQQLRPLTALLRRVRHDTKLSVIVFTGFTWKEVLQMSTNRRGEPLLLKSEIRNLKPDLALGPELLADVDVLITGRYEATRRLARGLRGSANKTVHLLTERYSADDVQAVPEAEIIIDASALVFFSGINPLRASLRGQERLGQTPPGHAI